MKKVKGGGGGEEADSFGKPVFVIEVLVERLPQNATEIGEYALKRLEKMMDRGRH